MTVLLAIPGVIIDGDGIAKALPGAMRGLGAERAGHKYIRRVRIYTPKGPRWQYYYRPEDLPEARARATAQAERRTTAMEHAGVRATTKEPTPKEAVEEHRPITQLTTDIPSLKSGIKPLKDLSTEYIQELIPGVTIAVTEAAMLKFHDAMVKKYGEDEPESLLSRPMPALRALEAAMKRLPPVVLETLGQGHPPIHLRVVDTSVDPEPKLIDNKAWSGYASIDGTIVVDVLRGGFSGVMGEAKMRGGLFPIEVILHELGHQIEFKPDIRKQWKEFLTGRPPSPRGEAPALEPANEPGVTDYAETDDQERFAESFAAALMFPRQLAGCAPKTYDWMRKLLGNAIPVRVTDEQEIAFQEAQLGDALKRNPSKEELGAIRMKLEMAEGLDRIRDDDPRIQWWTIGTENAVQHLLRVTPKPSRAKAFDRRDPIDPLATGDVTTDRFLEWSVNGRTVYLRIGPTKDDGDPTWAPTEDGAKGTLSINHVKEAYGEDGTPLDPLMVWWWLTQDAPPEEAEDLVQFSGKVYQTGVGKERQLPDVAINRNRSAVLKNQPQAVLKALAATAFGKVTKASRFTDPKQAQTWMPVEMNERDFRLRSGTFTFDRWERAGDDLLRKLSNTPLGDPLRAGLIKQLSVAQPFLALVADRDPTTGRLLSPTLVQTAIPEGSRDPTWGPHPIPQMKAIRYANRNPDGTTFNIQANYDPDHGHFFIADPVMRELLTPNGDPIVSAEDLKSACKQAAEAKRRTWMGVRIEAKGDIPASYHVQVEFDGRGSPLILGSFWKQRLGKDEPRWEDLLASQGVVAGSAGRVERTRAKIAGPAIKLPKVKVPTGRARLPQVGDRVMLKVRGNEVGRIEDQRVMVEVLSVGKSQEGRAQYVFAGVSGSGFPGRRLIREGEKAVLADVEHLRPLVDPVALEQFPLLYVHREVDIKTGGPGAIEVRMKLPKDGSISEMQVRGMSGVTPVEDGSWRIGLDQFHVIRDTLSGLVLTDDAHRMLADRIKAQKAQALVVKHQASYIKAEDVNPEHLVEMGVGVKTETPDGVPITYGSHQRRLVQSFFDRGQNLLAWHAPGTGKTAEALVCAQMALDRKDPDDPTKPHPLAPKKVAIVVPKTVLDNWKDEANLFGEGAIIVGAGPNYISFKEYSEHPERFKARMVIFGHEYWTRYASEIRELGFDGLIVDEIHKGTRSENNERVRHLREWSKNTKMQLFLSGTPVTKSLSDIVEMVRLLTKGGIWGGINADTFEEVYLTENPAFKITGATRGEKRAAPKTFLRPEMADEVASAVGAIADVAMPKDIRDKTLPAVRMGDSDIAEMVGVQAALYASFMASLSDADRTLVGSGAIADESEMARLSGEGQQAMGEAKRIANNPAYKPSSDEPWVTFTRVVPGAKKGEMNSIKEPLTTPDPAWLMDKKRRGKRAGNWPTEAELGAHQAALWSLHFQEVTDTYNYGDIAGTKITKEQLARAKKAGWAAGNRIANPDIGPAGIRARGYSEYTGEHPDAVPALELQRAYALALQSTGKGKQKVSRTPVEALAFAAQERGIAVAEAERLLALSPTTYEHHAEMRWGKIRVNEGETWYADKSASSWLMYRPQDFDVQTGKPKMAGGFEVVQDGDFVDVEGWKWPTDPDTKEAVIGTLRYSAEMGEDDKGRVYLEDEDGQQVGPVEKKRISKPVLNLLDPGMRAERAKADVAMVKGNAKAEKLIERIGQHFLTTGPGPDGERQMVLFAHNILDGCRTMEAAVRLMGFMDANEAIEGSPHYDPTDPQAKTGPPNGKYFVTYIGSTYTGDRRFNSEMFRKRKDRLDRDTETSMLVYRTMEGQKWPTDLRAGGDMGVTMSRWTEPERRRLKRQFKIDAPEAFTTDAKGTARYFYGSPESRKLLKKLATFPDPAQLTDPKDADQVRVKIAAVKQQYADVVKAGATTKPPMTAKQIHVFNNVAIVVASDAAKEGINWGNATEVFEYDTPPSPMDEWQRVSRAVRMLPKAVSEKLWGTDAKPGPFAKIAKAAREHFKPIKVGSGGGYFTKVTIHRPGGPDVVTQVPPSYVLGVIAMDAKELAGSDKANKDAWEAIRGRAEAARALGRDEMASALAEFRTTRRPGTKDPVLTYNEQDLRLPDPEEGTYAEVEMEAPVAAIEAAVESLSSEDREAIAKAGFAHAATTDAAAIYLAIRSQQILDSIEKRRPEVARELRSTAIGAAITDNDVTNALVDELKPEDRAILKTKKFLVNVRRIATAITLPTFVKRKSEEGTTVDEFAGYERQYPIVPESLARAVARSRQGPIESLLRRVEQGVTVRSPVDYQMTTPDQVALTSAMHKSMTPAIKIGASDA